MLGLGAGNLTETRILCVGSPLARLLGDFFPYASVCTLVMFFRLHTLHSKSVSNQNVFHLAKFASMRFVS
jgi:hypothetical protein